MTVLNSRNLKELRRVVNNFNAKIKRLEKSERELMLPDKVSMKDIKSMIKTKWDLNRRIKELELFSTRGIEKTVKTKGGVVTSKYNLELTKRNQKRLYQTLTRKIKSYGAITPNIFGIKQDATYRQMGDMKIQNLKARRKSIGKRNIEKLSKESFSNLEKMIQKVEYTTTYKDEVFKSNYMNSMLFILGYTVGYDRKKIEYIRKELLKLETKQFIKLFETDLGIQAITDYYSALGTVLNKDVKNDVVRMFDTLYNSIEEITSNYK